MFSGHFRVVLAFLDTFWNDFWNAVMNTNRDVFWTLFWHSWKLFDTYLDIFFDTCLDNILDMWTFFKMTLGTIFESFLRDIYCCSVTNRYLPPFYHLSREFRKRTLEKLAQEVRICQMDMAMVSSLILRFQQRLLRTDLHFWGFKT